MRTTVSIPVFHIREYDSLPSASAVYGEAVAANYLDRKTKKTHANVTTVAGGAQLSSSLRHPRVVAKPPEIVRSLVLMCDVECHKCYEYYDPIGRIVRVRRCCRPADIDLRSSIESSSACLAHDEGYF